MTRPSDSNHAKIMPEVPKNFSITKGFKMIECGYETCKFALNANAIPSNQLQFRMKAHKERFKHK